MSVALTVVVSTSGGCKLAHEGGGGSHGEGEQVVRCKCASQSAATQAELAGRLASHGNELDRGGSRKAPDIGGQRVWHGPPGDVSFPSFDRRDLQRRVRGRRQTRRVRGQRYLRRRCASHEWHELLARASGYNGRHGRAER